MLSLSPMEEHLMSHPLNPLTLPELAGLVHQEAALPKHHAMRLGRAMSARLAELLTEGSELNIPGLGRISVNLTTTPAAYSAALVTNAAGVFMNRPKRVPVATGNFIHDLRRWMPEKRLSAIRRREDRLRRIHLKHEHRRLVNQRQIARALAAALQ
jgi:hypothetical protein